MKLPFAKAKSCNINWRDDIRREVETSPAARVIALSGAICGRSRKSEARGPWWRVCISTPRANGVDIVVMDGAKVYRKVKR